MPRAFASFDLAMMQNHERAVIEIGPEDLLTGGEEVVAVN